MISERLHSKCIPGFLDFIASLTGALVFQLCLVCSAWLKFVPDADTTAQPPALDHTEAAVAMTVVLGAGASLKANKEHVVECSL